MMATDRINSIENTFTEALNDAVKRSINTVFDKAIENAVEEVNDKRDETIASMSLKLASWFSIENMGTTLRIVVEKPTHAPTQRNRE
jgi:hypothetical protein